MGTPYNYSNADVSAMFKRKYLKRSKNVFNAMNVVWGQLEQKEDFVGTDMQVTNPLSFSGGVGSGSLPEANVGKYGQSLITSKKIYATTEVDRETIKASATSEGSFAKAFDEQIAKTLESGMRNNSRMLFGDASGILGYGSNAAASITGAGTTGSPYLVTFTSAKFFVSNFEEKDKVQIVTGVSSTVTGAGGVAEATKLEIVEVLPATFQIKLVGTSAVLAAKVLAPDGINDTDAVVMQGSYMADLTGLRLISNLSVAGAGTIYNIPIQRRWSMFVKDAAAAALTVDLMDDLFLNVHQAVGKSPNLIVAGYTQFRKLKNLSESQKRYEISPKNVSGKLKASLSFEAVEFMSVDGPVPVVLDRFARNDELWALNTDFITLHMRAGGAEWHDEDGTVFLRTAGDSYEARWGFYGDIYTIPNYHGHLKNLAL